MKIALVTQLSPWRFQGGTELAVAAQAREFVSRGHQVQVVAGASEGCGRAARIAKQDVERSFHDGVSVSVVPRRDDEPYDLLLERPRVAAIVERELRGADVVHVHHWSTLCSDLVRRCSEKTPTFVTLHDDFTNCPRFFRQPPQEGRTCPSLGHLDKEGDCVACLQDQAPGVSPLELDRALLRRATEFRAELAAASAVIAPSRTHAERVARHLEIEAAELRVLPHGLCRPLIRVAAPRSPWRGERPLRVVHFGNLAEVKGTLDLIDALQSLRGGPGSRAADPSPGLEVEVLGREVEGGFLAELRRRSEGLAIRWSGPYDGRTLVARCAEADLAAFPSRAWESYGLVVDEAHALGLPTWVSDRGAPRERVGGAGRVLPARNPGAWARAFQDLLDQPQMLRQEIEAIPERLTSAADVAQRLESLYLGHTRRARGRRSGRRGNEGRTDPPGLRDSA